MSRPPRHTPAIRKEIILFLGDLVALCAIIPAALWLRYPGLPPYEIILGYLTFGPVLILWRIFAAYWAGLYDLRQKLTLPDHFFAGIGAALLAIVPGYLLLALAQLYGFSEVRVSRLVVLLEMGLFIAWVAGTRAIMLWWLNRIGWKIRTMLVGPQKPCEELAAEIDRYAPKPVEVTAAIHLEGKDPAAAARHIDQAIRDNPIDQIILVQPGETGPVFREVLRQCETGPAEVYLYPDLDHTLLLNSPVQSIAGLPLVSLRPAYNSRLYRLGKRILDLTAAMLLLILSLPILSLAVAAIKLTSKGPSFFVQARIGRNGKPFYVYKLRTMHADAEQNSGPVLAQRDDPRITPVGRTLRKWRIDEIPQLWNVLRGEMSLVGPRPEREAFVKQFIDENPLYERRLLVRPGLTGLAQIHGRYDTNVTHKLRYDLMYINSISLAGDLRILFATVQTVLTGKGAV